MSVHIVLPRVLQKNSLYVFFKHSLMMPATILFSSRIIFLIYILHHKIIPLFWVIPAYNNESVQM